MGPTGTPSSGRRFFSVTGIDWDDDASITAWAYRVWQQLTDDERLGLLDGDSPFWQGLTEMMGRYNGTPIVHGEVARLGIPGTRFVDGPRGCVAGNATAFPVSMARGATWDVDLEERVGRAIGAEIRVQGGNFFGGVCINLLRHPAWGRQETYGEDRTSWVKWAQRWCAGCRRDGVRQALCPKFDGEQAVRGRRDLRG